MFADFPGTALAFGAPPGFGIRVLAHSMGPCIGTTRFTNKLRLLTLCSVALHDLAVIKAGGIRRRVSTTLHSSARLRMGQGSFRCYHEREM